MNVGGGRIDVAGRPRVVTAERTGGNDCRASFVACDEGCGDAAHWRLVALAPVHNYLPDTVPMRRQWR